MKANYNQEIHAKPPGLHQHAQLTTHIVMTLGDSNSNILLAANQQQSYATLPMGYTNSPMLVGSQQNIPPKNGHGESWLLHLYAHFTGWFAVVHVIVASTAHCPVSAYVCHIPLAGLLCDLAVILPGHHVVYNKMVWCQCLELCAYVVQIKGTCMA
jgi:hypothetical protein